MNVHASESGSNLIGLIKSLVAKSRTGVELIRDLDGVHPIELKRALEHLGEGALLREALGPLDVTLPVLTEIERDDNPVLSFWPFTSDCASRILKIVPNDASIALLGVPTVFNALRNFAKNDVTLFDSDNYLFSKEATAGYVQCDLLSEVSRKHDNSFDFVLADPPWYLDEYYSWLHRAVSLTRPGGTVVFVLFPPNIRASAKEERNKILSLINEVLSGVEVLKIDAEYETPSFEKIELIRNCIAPVNWRRANFIRGRVPAVKREFATRQNSTRSESWTERRVGCGRIFIANRSADVSSFLETADPQSRFLASPSRREEARKRANVISSRGHGLCCRDPERLFIELDKIKSSGDINKIGLDLDHKSTALLRLIANDLWPRFITID